MQSIKQNFDGTRGIFLITGGEVYRDSQVLTEVFAFTNLFDAITAMTTKDLAFIFLVKTTAVYTLNSTVSKMLPTGVTRWPAFASHSHMHIEPTLAHQGGHVYAYVRRDWVKVPTYIHLSKQCNTADQDTMTVARQAARSINGFAVLINDEHNNDVSVYCSEKFYGAEDGSSSLSVGDWRVVSAEGLDAEAVTLRPDLEARRAEFLDIQHIATTSGCSARPSMVFFKDIMRSLSTRPSTSIAGFTEKIKDTRALQEMAKKSGIKTDPLALLQQLLLVKVFLDADVPSTSYPPVAWSVEAIPMKVFREEVVSAVPEVNSGWRHSDSPGEYLAGEWARASAAIVMLREHLPKKRDAAGKVIAPSFYSYDRYQMAVFDSLSEAFACVQGHMEYEVASVIFARNYGVFKPTSDQVVGDVRIDSAFQRGEAIDFYADRKVPFEKWVRLSEELPRKEVKVFASFQQGFNEMTCIRGVALVKPISTVSAPPAFRLGDHLYSGTANQNMMVGMWYEQKKNGILLSACDHQKVEIRPELEVRLKECKRYTEKVAALYRKFPSLATKWSDEVDAFFLHCHEAEYLHALALEQGIDADDHEQLLRQVLAALVFAEGDVPFVYFRQFAW